MSTVDFPYVSGVTVGITAKDGVVLASEKYFSYAYFIFSKKVKKTISIKDYIGVAFSGFIGDMQILTNFLKAQISLLELESNQPITVKAAAKLVSRILFSRRYFPFLSQTIVGGVDEKGAQLFGLDIIGSLIPDDFLAVGPGSEVAIGIIEQRFSKKMSIKDAANLAAEAIKVSIERSVGAGGGIDLLKIQKNKSDYMFLPL